MDQEKDIRFQPLTDGLGFHPFADGLPYAPNSKKPPAGQSPSREYVSGSGATAAGAPRFAYPTPSPGPSTIPTAFSSASVDTTAERIRRELESIQTQRLESARKIAHTLQPKLDLHYGIDYSIQRAFAFLLDSAFNLSVCASILSSALISTDLQNLKELSPVAATTAGIFLFLCNWALLAAQEVAFGTTLGKRIFGLRLEGNGIECLIRSVLFVPSLLFGGIGIWMAIFDARKRCWHDRMTKLQPEM